MPPYQRQIPRRQDDLQYCANILEQSMGGLGAE